VQQAKCAGCAQREEGASIHGRHVTTRPGHRQGRAQGVTARKLARFAIEAREMSQPVSIVVSTGDLTRPVDVMVVKDSFGTFGWLGLAVGAVAAIGLLLAGVGLLRRKPGGQWCDASSSC